jgi:YD repeat-containing protein
MSSSTNTSYAGANEMAHTVFSIAGIPHSVAGDGTYGPTGALATLEENVYTYDTLDRLINVTQGPTGTQQKVTLLNYDGLGRLVQITDKVGQNIVSERSYLYCGSIRCAEYDSLQGISGGQAGAVSKIYLPEGYETFKNGGPTHQGPLYIKDQLGTVRRVLVNGEVSADYQYGPFGNRTKIGGTGPESDFGFAGYFYHAPTGLQFAQRRAYDAQLGRCSRGIRLEFDRWEDSKGAI